MLITLLIIIIMCFSSTEDLELLLKFAERAGIAGEAPIKSDSFKLNFN